MVKKNEHAKLKEIPVATPNELSSYDGIAFGSPIYFGNMSTAMSEFLSMTVDLWTKHGLEGMPATVFMSAGSGAGKELAIQSIWNSLAVHGMILVSNGIRGNEKIDVKFHKVTRYWVQQVFPLQKMSKDQAKVSAI
ncbi:NAD(P)H-dependent oxidoreductase [Sphingobacterium sp. IITKGP-BTPF85]|uniref:NAD(P)H-dependent oxidoreductase n=1 Tax=Sphingobacterium sp. IITKGP-BTPF85 TaxID=1338009 RepID=UPI00041BE8D9|nr:NAD(P)H-dependent oxidoreductase [Sphingobacterium sp. IITKGP-BTPF85]KKX51050.1 hypothetical protein L950_0206705 [Sphingobacterium sp. IITKGP-BTPF85]